MKKFLLATALMTSAAFAGVTAAHAIDVTVGGEAGADITIGVGAGGADAGAGAAAGAAANVGAGAGGGAAAGEAMMPATDVMLRTAGGAEATVAADTLVATDVFTNDGAHVGTVSAINATADGDTVFVITVDDGWMEGVTTFSIYSSAMLQTDTGLQIDTDEADLRSSITAGMEAGAAAAAR